MKKKFIPIMLSIAILGGVLNLTSGAKSDVTESQSQPAIIPGTGTNGVTSTIPAYYDGKIFTIQFVEFSSKAEATLIARNPGINFIYQSDPGLPGNQPFISVIDAIPGDGMNPVWQEVQIVFNPGFTPRQLFSDNEVLAAAQGPNPEITLIMTTEVYKCPVTGHK